MDKFAPSLSDEEFFKYYIKDQNILDRIQNMIDRNIKLEKELELERKEYEFLSEQCMWRGELLEEILRKKEQTGSKKELVKAIEIAYENSYVEL